MSYWIPKSEYMPYVDNLDIDEQIMINHDNCPAGRDTRRRLGIKRTDDGYIAHCFNCGHRGYTVASLGHYKAAKRAGKSGGSKAVLGSGGSTPSRGLPEDCVGDTEQWPPRARAWVFKYGLNGDDIAKYRLGYSELNQRVVLPIYRGGELDGYQLRKIEDDDMRPKYMTEAYKKPLFWVSSEVLSSKPLVIVEDILSGIRVSKICNSVALLTATASRDVIDWLVSTNASEYVIFLDNDNRTVRKAQLALKNRLEVFAPTRIVTADKDPKEHTEGELRCLLKL